MTRIFTPLALLTGLALLAAYIVGTISKLRGSLANPLDATYVYHFGLGLGSAVLALLVHCLVFTYLLGTGRWVKEVTIAYQLPDEPWHKETRELKRRTYPVALIAMLVPIAAGAAGLGNQLLRWPWWIHFTIATITLLVNLWAFRIEYRNIALNSRVLDEVMVEVDRICAERGLPTNAERLKEQEAAN